MSKAFAATGRESHLDDIAGRNVLLGAEHDGFVVLPAQVGRKLGVLGLGFRGKHGRAGRIELRTQRLDLADRRVIGPVRVAVHNGIREDLAPVIGVIEDHAGIGEGEDAVRQSQIIGGLTRQALEEAHHIIAHEADRAAAEPRQPLDRHELVLGQQGRQRVQWVLPRSELPGVLPPVARDRHAIALGGEHREGFRADERVPPYLLAALHALQEERVMAVAELAER